MQTTVNPSPYMLVLFEVQPFLGGCSPNIMMDPHGCLTNLQMSPLEVAHCHLPAESDSLVSLWKQDSFIFFSWLPRSPSPYHGNSSPIARTWTAQEIQRNALEIDYHHQCPACTPTTEREQAVLIGSGFLVCQVWERVVTLKEVHWQNCPKRQNSFVWSKRWGRC